MAKDPEVVTVIYCLMAKDIEIKEFSMSDDLEIIPGIEPREGWLFCEICVIGNEDLMLLVVGMHFVYWLLTLDKGWQFR